MNPETSKSTLLPMIRRRVKAHLMNSEAWRALPPEKRKAVAHDTVNAMHYIVGGQDGNSRPGGVALSGNAQAFETLVQAQAGDPRKPKRRIPRRSRGFKPDAAKRGGKAFTDMIEDVDFPAFVGGLIDGVFNSIVTTSIKQMEAYAELVRNVSKSVDQYMKDNVSENDARDYLAEKYPEHLEVDITGEKPTLKPREGHEESNMPDFFADLGLGSPISSIDEDNVESELVPAARKRIAMDRQQLLATMVMMGVNRLVVTNGTIEASCMFELDTTDSITRSMEMTRTKDFERNRSGESSSGGSQWNKNSHNSKYDGRSKDKRHQYSSESARSGGGAKNWMKKSSYNDTAKFKMSTTKNTDTEQTVQMHANLGGKVKVNFKSDYFPMEKMVDALQINQIREKTPAGLLQNQPAQPAVPNAPPLKAPPLPNIPGVPGQKPPGS